MKPIQLMHSGTDAIKDADFSLKYVNTGSQEIDKLISVFNEMTDRLRAERILMSEQSYFVQKLIEMTPIGIIIMDYDGAISNINPSAKKILALKGNPIGQNLKDFHSALIDGISSLPIGDSDMISINGANKYKCQVQEVIHQGFKRKFVLIDDLSTELMESEKRAYGRIIRMMAHEVNNSIGAINSILDSVIEFGFPDEKDADLKSSLALAKKRNISLNKFMANYASILRLPAPVKQKVNLCELLKKTGQLYIPLTKEKGIRLYFDLPDVFVKIDADPILLEQAISNIIKNAIEAITDNGIIKISCKQNPPSILISDNGSGITPSNAKKLFTPFFSTKPQGQGVGLMLIREILQYHDAKFSLSTDSDTSLTTFEIVF